VKNSDYRDEQEHQYADAFFSNSAIIPANSVLTVTLATIRNPPNLHTQSDFVIFTADQYLNYVEYATYPTLTNSLPTSEAYSVSPSVASIEGLTGVLESNILYKFEVYAAGDIPSEGYFTLTIPNGVGLPTNPATGLKFSCL
jgi:hypothetical protein